MSERFLDSVKPGGQMKKKHVIDELGYYFPPSPHSNSQIWRFIWEIAKTVLGVLVLFGFGLLVLAFVAMTIAAILQGPIVVGCFVGTILIILWIYSDDSQAAMHLIHTATMDDMAWMYDIDDEQCASCGIVTNGTVFKCMRCDSIVCCSCRNSHGECDDCAMLS